MCYEYNEILCTLLRMIDSCSNDIFVHIDAKSDDFSFKLRQFVQYSDIFFVRDRIKVYWAHYSQIEAEYRLFRDAYRGGVFEISFIVRHRSSYKKSAIHS